MRTTRHYYKYYTTSWTQPTLTANIVPTDGFCAWNGWSSFYPNTSNVSIYQDEIRGWMEIYMYSHEYSIIPSSFTFYVVNSTDASSPAYNISFYGTNEAWVLNNPIPNGSNNKTRNSINTGDWSNAWTLLGSLSSCGESKTGTIDMSSVTESYKYFRFEASQKGEAYNDRLTIKNFHLYGSKVITIDGTSTDYDFYRDEYDPCGADITDNGTVSNTNYNIYDEFRPGVITDTITYKEDTNYIYCTNSSNGNIYVKDNYGIIDTTKAFNPTLGQYRVRPISATFTSTTISSQWDTDCFIEGWYSHSDGQSWTYNNSTRSTTFNGAIKGTYNVTWTNASFQYWWTFTPWCYGWSSSTQTLQGTLNNIVWEVENTGTHEDKDYKLYIVDNGTVSNTNYNIYNEFRPNVATDTITYKETSSTIVLSSSNIGTIKGSSSYYDEFEYVNTSTAFNPTLGVYNVRPISATFTASTISSQVNNVWINALYSNSPGSRWPHPSRSYISDNYASNKIYVDSKTDYEITWTNKPFAKWWCFTVDGSTYSSGTQTVAGTLSNIVWEVEYTGSHTDRKYYVFNMPKTYYAWYRESNDTVIYTTVLGGGAGTKVFYKNNGTFQELPVYDLHFNNNELYANLDGSRSILFTRYPDGDETI